MKLSTLVPEAEAGGEVAPGSALWLEEDFRPLFREEDIEEMKEVADFDLSDHRDVREYAEVISARLDDGTTLCDERCDEEEFGHSGRWIDRRK